MSTIAEIIAQRAEIKRESRQPDVQYFPETEADRHAEWEERVGPEGYIHGWIYVGGGGLEGDAVQHKEHGHGTVTKTYKTAGGYKTQVTFKSGKTKVFAGTKQPKNVLVSDPSVAKDSGTPLPKAVSTQAAPVSPTAKPDHFTPAKVAQVSENIAKVSAPAPKKTGKPPMTSVGIVPGKKLSAKQSAGAPEGTSIYIADNGASHGVSHIVYHNGEHVGYIKKNTSSTVHAQSGGGYMTPASGYSAYTKNFTKISSSEHNKGEAAAAIVNEVKPPSSKKQPLGLGVPGADKALAASAPIAELKPQAPPGFTLGDKVASTPEGISVYKVTSDIGVSHGRPGQAVYNPSVSGAASGNTLRTFMRADKDDPVTAKIKVNKRLSKQLSHVNPNELAAAAGIKSTKIEEGSALNPDTGAIVPPDILDNMKKAVANAQQNGMSTQTLTDLHSAFWYTGKGFGFTQQSPFVNNRITKLGDLTYTNPDSPQIKQALAEINGYLHSELKPASKATLENAVRQNAVKELVHGWAISSNDDYVPGLAVQRAATEVFGVTNSVAWHKETGELKSQVDDFYARNAPALKEFVKAQYALTQADLKKAGITHLTLVRGMGWTRGQEPDWAKGAKVGDSVSPPFRPLSSWSSAKGIAEGFAKTTSKNKSSVVLETSIPAEAILSYPQSGYGCLDEEEFVAIAGNGSAKVVTSDVR